MRTNLKKILSLIFTACSCVLFTSCVSATDDDVTTIKFFGWGKEEEQRNFQTMINSFMAENEDVKVVYQCVDSSGYDEALLLKRNSMPDVFYMSDFSFYKWAKSGNLLDMSSYITDEDKEGVWPLIYEMYRYDKNTKKVGEGNALYGLGKDLGPYTLVYNKTLMAKIAAEKQINDFKFPSATEPMTWQEFIDFLSALKYKDSNGNTVWGIGSYEIMHAVYSNNADFFTADAKTSRIGEKNFGDAIQFISDLTRLGVAPNYEEMNASGGYAKFLNEKCLMTFMGPWDLAAFWNDTQFEFDIMPTPVGTAEGAQSTSWMGSCAISCRKFSARDAKKEEAAVRLVKYLCLGETCANLNYKIGQAQPNKISVAENQWMNNVGITKEKEKQPASKQVWLDTTRETDKIHHHIRAKFYLYNGKCFDDLVSELNSNFIYRGKENAAKFCKEYEPTFQSGLDDSAAFID